MTARKAVLADLVCGRRPCFPPREIKKTMPTSPVSTARARPRIEGWRVVDGGSCPFQAPELRPIKLEGFVSNHPTLPDGLVTTSLIQMLDESAGVARTLSTAFELGAPSAKWAALMARQGVPRPLKYKSDPVTRVAEQRAAASVARDCRDLWSAEKRCASTGRVIKAAQLQAGSYRHSPSSPRLRPDEVPPQPAPTQPAPAPSREEETATEEDEARSGKTERPPLQRHSPIAVHEILPLVSSLHIPARAPT